MAQRRAEERSARNKLSSDLERMLDEAATQPPVEARSFASLGLPPALVTALARKGMQSPFAIQARTLPDALAGRDILGRAQTGSGKTLGFGLPMLTRLAGGPRTPHAPRGLVLVPTRELAGQVEAALAPLGHALDVRLTTVYGGAPMGRQIKALTRGVDIVVATPGRLQDLIRQGQCRLNDVQVAVLDEADFMSDLGFLPVVREILDMTPNGGQRMLFSATLDGQVAELVGTYLKDPAVHAVAPAAAPVQTMDHRVFRVDAESKTDVAAEIASRPGRTLFFVRTKHGADRLAKHLGRSGQNALALHGGRTQSARERALADFAAGRTRVLVATDVAARGLHIDDVDLVVHFDPPNDAKDYLHRSGRTARAGNSGLVLSLLLPEQVREAARLRTAAGVTADVHEVTPGAQQVREVAESGTPIVVQPRPETPVRSERPRRSSSPRPYGRRPEGGGDSRRQRPGRRERDAQRTARPSA